MHHPVRTLLLTTFLCIATCGCQVFEPIGEFTKRTYRAVVKKTPRDAVRKMEDPTFADRRREGINQLVDYNFGKKPPYTERYRQIASLDEDYTVRATAIRALNRSRDKEATRIFITRLFDEKALVRLEAAKALNRVPDPAAVPGLTAHLQESYATGRPLPDGRPETIEETRDVRIACAEALRHYKTLEVARALAAAVGSPDFAVSWQSRRSLRSITGKDFGYNQSEWLNYISNPEKPLGG